MVVFNPLPKILNNDFFFEKIRDKILTSTLEIAKCFNSEFDNDNNKRPSINAVQCKGNETLLARISNPKAFKS